MSLILKIQEVKNQIPTTKTTLKAYQNNLWVISKKANLCTNKIDSKKILNIFKIKKAEIENITE